MTVYVVHSTTECFDDVEIHTVFSTKDAADEYTRVQQDANRVTYKEDLEKFVDVRVYVVTTHDVV